MDKYIDIAKMLLLIIVWGYINVFVLFSIALGTIEVIDSFRNRKEEEK